MAELEKQKELDFERKHQEDLERIRNFRLMDDDFRSSAATMGPGPSVHGITAAYWTQTSRKKATGTIR